MSEDRPWETGATQGERWVGYFQPGYVAEDQSTHVLRNKLDGIRSPDQLAYIEGSVSSARALFLEHAPVEPATYDLEHLRAIHHELFQDVYEWAGELRTVEMGKGGAAFAPREGIADIVNSVGKFLESNDYFRGGDRVDVVSALAVGYDMVNAAHPFREGNGRTQRIFWDQFASESGHYIAWDHLQGRQNDIASQQARSGNKDVLPKMFGRIVHREEDRAAVDARRIALQGMPRLSLSPSSSQPEQSATSHAAVRPYQPPAPSFEHGGPQR